MPKYRSSLEPCTCPDGSVSIGEGAVTFVDYLDGNPAEMGTYTADLSETGTSFLFLGETEEAELKEGLGLPSLGTEGDTPTLLFKMGSGIKVSRLSPEWHDWKAYRLDCGCLKYTCVSLTDDDGTGATGGLLPCNTELFTDAEGNIDFSCDQLEVIPTVALTDDVGVHDGSILNGAIPDLLQAVTSGTNESFNNYVDAYGIVYSAFWKQDGDLIDITFIKRDPIVPGVGTSGRIVKTKNGLRIFRTGVITATREVLRLCNDTTIVVKRGSSQVIGEFQATFGCGEEKGDPFHEHLDHSVTDQVEFLMGTSILLSDPEEETFVWEPQVVVDETGNVVAFDLPGANLHGPIEEIPAPAT